MTSLNGDSEARTTADAVARRSYGKLVAFLAARTRDVSSAEDALSDAFASAELLTGLGFARVDSDFGAASDVTVMDRPLRVLSKVTDTPYMRNCGATRRSSLPSLLHVFGQLADAAFFLPTISTRLSQN